MIKNIEERIAYLEERRNQAKENVKNKNLSEDIREYEKGTAVSLREEIKYLKSLIELIRG